MIIDFHSHILPGIDDGSRNSKTSRDMLFESLNQGVTHIFATPHFYANEMSIDSFLQKRDEALLQINDYPGPMIIPGAEVAFFPGISEAQQIDRLAVGNLILVEMPFREWKKEDIGEVKTLIKRGCVPIIAHVERFACKSNMNLLEELVSLPVVCQINCETIIDNDGAGEVDQLLSVTTDEKSGLLGRKKKYSLWRPGTKYVLGSDCHGMHRRPQNIAEGRRIIADVSQELLNNIDKTSEELINTLEALDVR